LKNDVDREYDPIKTPRSTSIRVLNEVLLCIKSG